MLFSCHFKNLTLNIEIHTAIPIYRSQFICYLFANRTDLRRIYLMLWAKATYSKSFSLMQLKSLMHVFQTGLT